MSPAPTDPSTRPLDGVRVLDLGQIYNGPYAGFLLAEAGADVVKIEPPTGESLRSRGLGRLPLAFAILNQDKRGLALDLKAEPDRALFLDLVREADVLLENFAPGVMDRLGLGAERLMEENPRLVYASGTGYGLSGEDSDRLAMDLTVQAASGLMSLNGPPDGPPLKTGIAICDFMGGVHLYSGIVTALFERSRTGRGRVVEIAMQEAILPALATSLTAMHMTGGRQPERRGNRHPAGTSAPYNVYRAADGWIAIICVTERHWLNLVEAMGRPDLLDDPRFADQATRAGHVDATDATVEAWTSALTRAEIRERLEGLRVPVAAVRELPEVAADPNLRARGAFAEIDHPDFGRVALPGSPLRFHGAEPAPRRPSPALGADAAAVVADWLGLDPAAAEARVAALGAGGNASTVA